MRLSIFFGLVILFSFQPIDVLGQEKSSLVLVINDASVDGRQVLEVLNSTFTDADFKIDELHILDIDSRAGSFPSSADDNLLEDKYNRELVKEIRKRVDDVMTFQTVLAKNSKNESCDSLFIMKMVFEKLRRDPISFPSANASASQLFISSSEDAFILDKMNDREYNLISELNLAKSSFSTFSTEPALRKFLERRFENKKDKKRVILFFNGAKRIQPIAISNGLKPEYVVDAGTEFATPDVFKRKIEITDFQITPLDSWRISNYQGFINPKDSATYKLSVQDKNGCKLDTTFTVKVKAASKPSKQSKVSNDDDRVSVDAFGDYECDCGDGAELQDLFGEIEWGKYSEVSARTHLIDGFHFFSNQAGGRIFHLITTRNCAASWQLRIFNRDQDEFYSEVYTREDVLDSEILKRPNFDEYFVFKIDLSAWEYMDQWYGDNYFRIVIESLDPDGAKCDTHKTPYVIFSKCKE